MMARTKRWTVVVLMTAWALSACMRQAQGLRPAEIDMVVIYVEEAAHGLPVDPLELLRPDGSPDLMRIASWAQGHRYSTDRFEHPNLIADRRRRWPLLRQGLARGVVAYEEDGSVRLTSAAADDDRRLLTPLVHQENLDRVALVSVLLTRGGLHGDLVRRQQLIDGVVAERLRYARAAGGRSWNASSTSTSPEAAPTPSASPPAAARRSAP